MASKMLFLRLGEKATPISMVLNLCVNSFKMGVF